MKLLWNQNKELMLYISYEINDEILRGSLGFQELIKEEGKRINYFQSIV